MEKEVRAAQKKVPFALFEGLFGILWNPTFDRALKCKVALADENIHFWVWRGIFSGGSKR